MAAKGELWEAHSIVGMTRHPTKKGRKGALGDHGKEIELWAKQSIVSTTEGEWEDKGWWE